MNKNIFIAIIVLISISLFSMNRNEIFASHYLQNDSLKIQDCNSAGIDSCNLVNSFINIYPYKNAEIKISNSTLRNSTITIFASDSLNIHIEKNLLINSQIKFMNSESEILFRNNTVDGIQEFSKENKYCIQNNIFLKNLESFSDSNFVQNNEISYNCFSDSLQKQEFLPDNIFGIANLDKSYQLKENSPCINAAAPDFDGDGIEYEYLDDTQKYGSRNEIGCYDYEEGYDTKYLMNKRYNWICFPRLRKELEVIENVINPHSLKSKVFSIIDDKDVIYSAGNWQGSFDINQTDGYKLKPYSPADYIELRLHGEVVSRNTPITLLAGVDNFVGFTIPDAVSFDEVFRNESGDCFDLVSSIKADNFYYKPMLTIRGVSNEAELSPSSTIRNFEYGKAYIINVKEDITLSDGWFYPTSATTREKVKDAKQFDVTYKSDYEVIDIINIPENVEEVGVFEGEECIGSAVVENIMTQVLVFSERSNRDFPFTIEFYTGERGRENADYHVYDNSLATFIDKPVLARKQEYSLVRIKGADVLANKVMKLDAGFIYPNPFTKNSSRTGVSISYNITKEARVSASVYNIKGQKIAEVFTGNMDAGKHTISWNGISIEGNQVASGVYFMKVKAGDKYVTRKFVIMK